MTASHTGDGPARFGELVRQYRRGAGLTQREVADRAGISVRGLRGLERGRVSRPRTGTVLGVANALRLAEGDTTELLRLREPGPAFGGIRLRVLGPLEAQLDGASATLGSNRQWALLGLLAVSANAPVSLAALIGAVWGEQPPATAAELIYARVSRLRRRLRFTAGAGPVCRPVRVGRRGRSGDEPGRGGTWSS